MVDGKSGKDPVDVRPSQGRGDDDVSGWRCSVKLWKSVKERGSFAVECINTC